MPDDLRRLLQHGLTRRDRVAYLTVLLVLVLGIGWSVVLVEVTCA